MDDELRLVRAMARRDRSAWNVMYDRHVRDVFGLVYHLVGGDRHVAEDVNQEVWLLAIEQFDRFDPGRGRFRDWLLGIARHRTLRHHRCARVRAIGSQPDSPDGGLPPTPLPSRRGVILPSDVGAGTGPSPGGRDPAAPPGDPGTPAP